MKLKLYTIASILLIIAVSVYAYLYFGEAIINHKLIALELALPTYIWVIVPMVLMFLVSLFHMIFYGLKLKFELSRWYKDSLNLQDTFNAILLGKKKKFSIKHKELNQIAEVLEHAKIKIDGDLSNVDANNKLLENMNVNKTIHSGGFVKLSKSGYNSDSEILIKNHLNRLETESDFAKQVIKSKENYSKIVVDKAVELYALSMEPKELKSLFDVINKTALKTILKRIQSGEFKIDEELAKTLYKKCDRSLLYTFTDAIKAQLDPDKTVALFKELYETDADAKEIYIYLLLEFEMTEQANEILVEESGYENFKAYLDLKQIGKRYPLSMFIK